MENSQRFSKNDDVYILDNKMVEVKVCIHGVVEEVGEETVLIKWDDLPEETEYGLSDLPNIQHKEFETGHDERFTEIQKLKTKLGIADQCTSRLRKELEAVKAGKEFLLNLVRDEFKYFAKKMKVDNVSFNEVFDSFKSEHNL